MNNSWIKNISFFLGGQTISQFGSALVQYAIMWYITLETKSGLMMTISIICGFLPSFFLSPFAGVWADRYNRKYLIIIADSTIALATFLLAILFLLGYNFLWLLFLISAIRSLGAGIQSPAIGAFIPQFVPQNKLIKINGINSSIHSVVILLAPMLSAMLLTFTKIEYIFFIDVITAIIGIATLMFFVNIPPHTKDSLKAKTDYFSDLKAGIHYIKGHKYVRHFFIFCIFFFFLIAPVSFLTPLQVTRNYGGDVWRLTAIEISFSIGMMIGGFAIGYLYGFKNKIHTMAFATLITALTTFILGFKIYFWIYLIVVGIMGLAVPMFHTTSSVLLQTKVENEYLGRVFGVLSMISSSMVPLGMLVFGPLSDIISIELILIITAIVLTYLGIRLFNNKTLLAQGI